MMEFIKYEIQRDDTLESIAEKYGRTVNELLDFHNSQSLLTQQIHSAYIPMHIDTILLSSEYKKKDSLRDINAYKIISKNEYFNFKNLVYSTRNEIVVEIEKLNNNKYAISQKSKTIECSSPHYDNYLVLMSLLDRPFEYVVLIIDDFGQIKKIGNQNEIEEQWSIVQKELSGVTDDKEMLDKLIKDGAPVYTDSLSHIKANLQYNLLYPGKFENNGVNKINEGPVVKLYSSLFSGSKILLKFKNRIIEHNNDILTLENKSFLEKSNIETLRELYNVSFRELLGNDFNYNLSLISNYYIKNNLIDSCIVDFIENINDTIVAKSSYEINKIKAYG
ncbi:hypothetical protein B0A69_02300 [Chryseobacterium shigense]|uniref:LysM domain-containing protein n=1 Tax=Chryseobacterium shigense TaxID=297244 RepID=A0A1N7I932_9FLAO|nr:LysM domain-containing protein [Chryseobacterium shigense]PQA96916.1 hypothetical protein B0A69_02300 [Chryseobacterium shigense]SIS33567.1 hypothetical protein SAMN05421639_102671 [Chryseobacterium shigense]